MTRRIKCTLRVVKGFGHTQQILAGYLLLHRAGLIDLHVKILPMRNDSWPTVVEGEVAGRRIAYQLFDGGFSINDRCNIAFLESLDALFVRSHSPNTYGAWEARVHPLGLNYPVFLFHPTALRCSYARLRDLPLNLLSVNRRPRTISFYEQEPMPKMTQDILFLTRVWDPKNDPQGDSLFDFPSINERRIELIEALRATFSDQFVGGIVATPYAQKKYAGYIAPRQLTNRKTYSSLVKSAAVCIATEGLARSNGWKLTEYVAASKAIVTEPLYYDVPGDFRDGVNYLSFRSSDQCVAAVGQYLADPRLIAETSQANWSYYNEWIRPDAMVLHTIETALRCS